MARWDQPGAKYADAVRILPALGCDVSIVDPDELASTDPQPSGGKREPVKGWDAADAVGAEWQDIAALRKAAHGLARPFEPAPEFVSWGNFAMDSGGLTPEITKGRGDNATAETIWISSAFEVIGACHDPNGRGIGNLRRTRFHDGSANLLNVECCGARWISSRGWKGSPVQTSVSIS